MGVSSNILTVTLKRMKKDSSNAQESPRAQKKLVDSKSTKVTSIFGSFKWSAKLSLLLVDAALHNTTTNLIKRC